MNGGMFGGVNGSGVVSVLTGSPRASSGDDQKIIPVPLFDGRYHGRVRVSNSLGSSESDIGSSEPEETPPPA